MNYYLLGSLAGIAEVLSTHPIDNYKIQKQYTQHYLNKPFTWKNIKLNHIHKGILPRLLGNVPMRMTFWSIQANTQNYLSKYSNLASLHQSILVGLTSGSICTIIDCPIENKKIKSMVSTPNHYKSQLFLKNLFRGFTPHLYRNSLFASIFCGTHAILPHKNELDRLGNSIIGSSIGCIITQPLDCIKTIQQSRNINIGSIQLGKKIIKQSGIKGLFNGLVERTLLGTVGMAIGYFVFNEFKDL